MAAILASLASTCPRHAIDPQIYFTQLLTDLPLVAERDLAAWLPDRWKLDQKARLTNLHAGTEAAS